MKTMYTAKFYQNAIIVIACVISCAVILTLNSYYTAKEKPQAPQVSFFDYLDNGFTLSQR